MPGAPFAFFSGPLPWLVLAASTVVFLWIDLHFFARGRRPSFREGVVWSIGWLVVSLLAAVVVLVLSTPDDAVTYTTVYFIERSLSLDNLFVFLLLFAYFGVPEEHRARLLFWGIVAALVLRGLFVLVEGLIRRFRYLDETIAVVLAVVAVKLLLEDVHKVGPVASLAVVAACFAVGIAASLWADARDPDAAAKREERAQRTEHSAGDEEEARRAEEEQPAR
jgi:tellurite resistance protein TerC